MTKTVLAFCNNKSETRNMNTETGNHIAYYAEAAVVDRIVSELDFNIWVLNVSVQAILVNTNSWFESR